MKALRTFYVSLSGNEAQKVALGKRTCNCLKARFEKSRAKGPKAASLWSAEGG
jgi:hypothetical protein